MKYLSMAVTGLIVGALAKLLYIGDNSNSWLMSMVLGVGGSFVAGFLGSMRDGQAGAQLKPGGFLFSIVGAMLLIFIGKQMGFAL